MQNKRINLCLLMLIGFLAGCTSSSSKESADMSALESYNHSMFKFNNVVDKTILRPVAKGYKAVTNDYLRQRITNFFNNIAEPISAANHLLQGDLQGVSENISRFMVNSTIGGLGLYDVAAKAGLNKNKTGFDETLASWCVPDGPYIVLPIMGGSTPRAATGFVADGYTSPGYWIAHESNGDDAMLVYYGAAGLKYLNIYAENLKILEDLEENSVDYYEAMKSMYLQNRAKIKGCKFIKKQEDNASLSYDFDMDMDDD